LAASGCEVLFLTRRPEQALELTRNGVRLEDPATGASLEAPVRATAQVAEAASQLSGHPLLFCTRAADLAPLAEALSRLAPEATAVSAQNGVDSDALLARFFRRVAGLVVRQTCTRFDDRSARAAGRGRLIVGGEADTEALAASLDRADYDVGLSRDLGSDRWLKLCINLASAPNALVVRQDHSSWEFVEAKARLLEEARDVLGAAGIRAASCDGRDRSLDEEIMSQRASLEQGTSARNLPLYNQVWSALRHGGSLEADAYHRTICELGRVHHVAAPSNARVLELLLLAAREARGPESLRAAELL
jgi:2-dehydropantoate 2-reductase